MCTHSRRRQACSNLGSCSGQTQVVNSRYIVGLWEAQLPQNLLWRTTAEVDIPKPSYASGYRALSWSWAAINGYVTLSHKLKYSETTKKPPAFIKDLAQVICIDIVHIDDSFDQIASGSLTCKGGLIPLHISLDPSLSIIEEREEIYSTVMHHFKLHGESYFGVDPPGAENYYGAPIMGTWKHLRKQNREHVYIEGLLLTRVAAERGTYRRVGEFMVFEPYNGVAWEASPTITVDDYIQVDSVHERGFQQYVFKII